MSRHPSGTPPTEEDEEPAVKGVQHAANVKAAIQATTLTIKKKTKLFYEPRSCNHVLRRAMTFEQPQLRRQSALSAHRGLRRGLVKIEVDIIIEETLPVLKADMATG